MVAYDCQLECGNAARLLGQRPEQPIVYRRRGVALDAVAANRAMAGGEGGYVRLQLCAVDKVAAYVAKYATKAAECTGTADRRITPDDRLADLPVRDHARRHIAAFLRLGELPQLKEPDGDGGPAPFHIISGFI